jgi:hypothetical protein
LAIYLQFWRKHVMATYFSKRTLFLTGLTTIGVWTGVSGLQSASAQTNPVADIQPLTSPVELLPQVSTATPEPTVQAAPLVSEASLQNAQDAELVPAEMTVQPIVPQLTIQNAAPPVEDGSLEVSQTVISPGRSTRSGPSYLGIGGNIGLGGNTTLGDSGFVVLSKIGLTRNLSARPSIVIGDNDPSILLPLTVDFPISSVLETGELNLEAAPFVGGGIAISTGNDGLVRPLISAGIDVPVARRITATAAVNFAFFDDTEVGLTLGAGYSF